MPPSQSFADEDFNVPSPERLVLLERLQTLLGDVPPHFWAACHLCDLQKLELIVQLAEISPSIVFSLATQAYAMVKTWSQSLSSGSRASTPQSPSTPQRTHPPSPTIQRVVSSSPSVRRRLQSSSLPEPSSPSMREPAQDADIPPAKRQKTSYIVRSKLASDSAKRRDNARCVLTYQPIVEVAHIYPFCLLDKEEEEKFGMRHNFWRMLKCFWPEEKVSSWEAAIFSNGLEKHGDETIQNLITLSKDVHGLWNKGFFALKPISMSEDNRTLTIQFFWQAKHSSVMPTINLTTPPLSTKDLDESQNNAFLIYQADRSHFIKSGDIFYLTTDDPEARPLPSIALLEMQWFLQRVMGMAGAADECEDPDFDEDGDDIYGMGRDEAGDSISNMGLDEAGDESFLSSGLADPIIPDNTSTLPSVEVVKHQTEETEEGMFRDGAVM